MYHNTSVFHPLTISSIFFTKTSEPNAAEFYVKLPLGWETKVCSGGLSHITDCSEIWHEELESVG